MVQKKGNVTSELYLRYIYTVSKVGYIYIKSVIPVMCTTGNWLRWVTDPCRNPVAPKVRKRAIFMDVSDVSQRIWCIRGTRRMIGSFFMDVIKIILGSELRQNLHFLRARQTSHQRKWRMDIVQDAYAFRLLLSWQLLSHHWVGYLLQVRRIWKCTARYCSMSWRYSTSSLSIAPRLTKRHEAAWNWSC